MNSTIIILLLVVSLVSNIILLWYCRNLVKFIKLTTQDMTSLYESVDSFKEHLKKVYGLETFYGDQTLKSLLDHTKQLSGDVGDFIEINQNLIYGDEDA
jgi:hypothetical protein